MRKKSFVETTRSAEVDADADADADVDADAADVSVLQTRARIVKMHLHDLLLLRFCSSVVSTQGRSQLLNFIACDCTNGNTFFQKYWPFPAPF